LNDGDSKSQKSSKSERKSNENKKTPSFEGSLNAISKSKSEQNLIVGSYKGSEHDLMSVKIDNHEGEDQQ
jgi:hypothetical protein